MKKEFDAERAFDKMFQYMQDMRTEMNERFDNEIGGLNQRFDRIERILDESVGDYKNLVVENSANAHGIARISDSVDNHEQRIVSLEKMNLDRSVI